MVTEVVAELGFSRPEEVIADHENRGLKRATTRPLDAQFTRQFEHRNVTVRDWSAPEYAQLNLRKMGFDCIDLSPIQSLQTLLGQVRQAGEISPQQARQLRWELSGKVFPLSGGGCLKLLFIAAEGLILRSGGPNGLKIDPDLKPGEMNGHDVALAIHGDQDVRGTPLKQMMRGFAPWLFRHQTPDGSNKASPVTLVNLWLPLQQITRPLTLMDRRTLNAREQQLRYGLPTESFLDRREDMRTNDIWSFLYDDAQQWYFHSDMHHDKAYVFDTLGEPHGSFILPGENVAEFYYLQLRDLSRCLSGSKQSQEAVGDAPEIPAATTDALRRAIDAMVALVASAPTDQQQPEIVATWLASAATAMDSVVRKSLEMRVVAALLPDVWPFNRSAVSQPAPGSGEL